MKGNEKKEEEQRENDAGATSDQSFSYVPEAIVLDILPKLPVDSLHRFRCVAKQWSSWISEIKNPRQKLIMRSASPTGRVLFKSVEPTTRLENMDVPFDNKHFRIFGSCHGLLLIRSFGNLHLWNPTIGWRKRIFLHDRNLGCKYNVVTSGLCFDSQKKDYKIVMALNPKMFHGCERMVLVGSCKSRAWTGTHLPDDVESVHSGPFFNSYLHWVAMKSSSRYSSPDAIIYFDPAINRFLDFPNPESETDTILGLGVLRGRLCMTRNGQGSGIEVLEMKEYGVGESWSSLFKIEELVYRGPVVPLLYSNGDKGEFLMKVIMNNKEEKIVRYDTHGNSLTDMMAVNCQCDAMVYEETLVRPVGYDWKEKSSKTETFYMLAYDSDDEPNEKYGYRNRSFTRRHYSSYDYCDRYGYDEGHESDRGRESDEDYEVVANKVESNLGKSVKTTYRSRRS